jgi:type II secretory pathway component PulC
MLGRRICRMHRLLNNLSARLANPFRWLMVAGIAYTLANSLMYLLAGPESAPGPAPAARTDSQAARPSVDIEPLLARNLFGIAGARPVAAQTSAAPTVATQLPLELRGVFVAEGDGVSAAIIAQRGRPGQLYSVGQNIAGSATLENVQADHVILRRAGVAETLHFPRAGQAQNLTPASDIVLPPEAPVEEFPDDGMPADVEPYEALDEPPLEDPMLDAGTNTGSICRDRAGVLP